MQKIRSKALTDRMTTAQLRFLLVISRIQLVADAIEQLYIALLRVLLQRRDECVGHCTYINEN